MQVRNGFTTSRSGHPVIARDRLKTSLRSLPVRIVERYNEDEDETELAWYLQVYNEAADEMEMVEIV